MKRLKSASRFPSPIFAGEAVRLDLRARTSAPGRAPRPNSRPWRTTPIACSARALIGHAAAAPAYRIDTPAGGRHRSAVEIGNFGNFPVLGGKHHRE